MAAKKPPQNAKLAAGRDGAVGAALGCLAVLVFLFVLDQMGFSRSVWIWWSVMLFVSPVAVVLGFVIGASTVGEKKKPPRAE